MGRFFGGCAAHWGDAFGWTLRERAQNANFHISDDMNESCETPSYLMAESIATWREG